MATTPHHHGAGGALTADVRAKAILLHAIFPSLHPSVAEETAATTTSIAHGVRRAHRILFPSTTLGKDIDGAASDEIRRAHHDYLRHTVVNGTQVTDVSHRREFASTVEAWRVGTDSWDHAHAAHTAKKLTSRFLRTTAHTPTTAQQHPTSPYFEQSSGVTSEASPPAAASSEDRTAVATPLTSSGTEQHPAPVWLTSIPLPPSIGSVRYKVMSESSSIRAQEPLERYADVFDPHDHKGSLAKELFLDGGDDGFQKRWADASPHLLSGLCALATSGPIMSSNIATAGIELKLPTFGHCFLRHGDVIINTFQMSSKHSTVSLLSPKVQKKVEAHEPADDNASHHHTEGRPLLNVKTKRVKVKVNPITLTITPATVNSRPDAQRKVKEDVVVVTVSVKNVTFKFHGDVLLAPSGRHTVVVEKADVSIGSLSISTDRCGYNMILFVLTPIVKRILQGEIASGLVGRRPL
jgi:hypothetical protein